MHSSPPPRPPHRKPFWRRFVRGLWEWPLAALILFEEWGWEPLQRAMARIGQWPGFRWIGRWIESLPPYGALALFALPTLALLPVKLLALFAISRGHALLGTLVIVAAKVAGTAIVARLFTLTQPALMRLAWFARNYARWTVFKERLLAQVRASRPWRAARVVKRRMGRWVRLLKRWLSRD
ncbi:hypothetical protein LRH25_06460 [Ideonella azotifigens]|uniref:Transmembrane protein n=1 Tax=Ideonella azotifigens TaxID=513160 RepID=A0ABN1JNS3_9BURK|nr:hypothetical protein [Ideonella azotifigens]MCD2339981.1 hypothetical protein [Ideonella azotifigens]